MTSSQSSDAQKIIDSNKNKVIVRAAVQWSNKKKKKS